MAVRKAARHVVALSAAALVVAAACAPSTDDDDQAGEENGGEKVTLTVWSWRAEDADTYEKIFDTFESKNSDIEVEFVTKKNTEYNALLQTALTEAGGPDVAQLRAYGQLQPLVAGGSLVALDGEVDGLDAFPSDVLDGARGREDGKVYGVPFAVQTLGIYYNEGLFQEQGISVPTTWDDMIAAAEQLKAAGITPFAVAGGADAGWTLPIVHEVFGATRYGGPDFTDAVLSGGKDFTAPEYVASLQLVKDLQPYFPEDLTAMQYDTGRALFMQGQAAMYPGGIYELGFFQSEAPDLSLGFFEAPPAPEALVENPLTVGWVDGSWGVNAKSENQEAALKLVEWMATPEFGQMFTDELKQVSPVPGVEPSDPILAETLRNYTDHGTPYLLLVHFRYGQPLGTDLALEGMQKLLNGEIGAADVSQSIQKGVSEWFKPGQ